jgi:hypothetical protein
MFGLGPATRIYLAAEATDMRNYAPSIDMWSSFNQNAWPGFVLLHRK